MIILARELTSDSIAFPNVLSGDLSLQDLPVEIDDLLKEFVDVVPQELPSELPPLHDSMLLTWSLVLNCLTFPIIG